MKDFSITITDINGRQHHIEEEIDDLIISNSSPGGHGFCILKLKRAPNFTFDEFQHFNDLQIIDTSGFRVFDGRIEDPPRFVDEQGIGFEIRALGHSAHLKDEIHRKVFCDYTVTNWDASRNNSLSLRSWDLSMMEASGQAQLRVATVKDQPYVSGDQYGFEYPMMKGLGQVKRIRANAEWDLPANLVLKLEKFVPPSTYTILWSRTNGSGSGTIDVDCQNAKYLSLRIEATGNYTGPDTAKFGRLFYSEAGDFCARIYGYDIGSNPANLLTVDKIVKDILENSCPFTSADYSGITVSEVIEPFMFEDWVYPEDMLNKLLEFGDWTYEIFERGIDEYPRLDFRIRDNTTVHYWANVGEGVIGVPNPSAEELYNVIVLGYIRTDGTYHELTGVDDDPNSILNKRGLNRVKFLTVAEHTTDAEAQDIITTQLDNYKVLRNQGSIVLTKPVEGQYGAEVPLHRIRAGKNIYLRGLYPARTTLSLDGYTMFQIRRVEYHFDGERESCSLELDNMGTSSAIQLAKLALGYQR